MKTCRLKIITANIIDNVDTPQIHYISKIKKLAMTPNKINNEENKKNEDIIENKENKENKMENNLDEDNLNQNENIEKIGEVNNNIQYQSQEFMNNNENNNLGKNNQDELKNNGIEEKIDINDLYTISNQNLNKINNDKDNNEYNSYNHLNNNYPYTIMNKKKSNNNSLRSLFKNRETKYNNNKNSYNLKNSQKSISSLKSINSNNKYKNKKSKISLNHSINKSFGLNSKSSVSLTLKNKNLNKSVDKNLNKSINNKSINKSLYNNKSKINSKKDGNIGNNPSEIGSWKIVEKNDYNIGQIIDYKSLIDDLIIKECRLVKEKEECIQIFEQKLKPLRELNQKLLDENNEELNRADELNGELILLKNKYEILFNNLYPNKDKNNNNKNNFYINDSEFIIKQKKIDNEIKLLNDKFKRGEFLLVTRPANHQKLANDEDKIITFLLKGLFYSLHILDTDKIVDIIWKFNKEIQTIYFLVEELLNFYNLDAKSDRNILINYFYSFCSNYSYMDISQFKTEFKKKIGIIRVQNKYIYLSKLLHFHNTKVKVLMKLIKKKDIFNRGVINYNKFSNLLYGCGITFNSLNQNFEEILEFLIYCMKKERNLNIFQKNKDINDNKDEKEIKNSIYDLYYESLNDFIDEYNSNNVSNPYILIKNYMNENDIINAEKLLRPILTEKNILKINSINYIDIIVLNKFLRLKGIIKKDDKILVNTFEEELVDINKFINDIYDCENIDEKHLDDEDLKKKADNLVDEILQLNF